MGVTEYLPEEEIEHTMDRADKALCDARQSGRNKMVVAKPGRKNFHMIAD
jgi:PleD family two-component response regulator